MKNYLLKNMNLIGSLIQLEKNIKQLKKAL